MALIQRSGTALFEPFGAPFCAFRVDMTSDFLMVRLLMMNRQAKELNTDLIVAVKNLRVGRDLESAKRALREVEMLKHFRGSENVRLMLLKK